MLRETIALVFLALPAFANEWIVDASGGPNGFTNITQAMAVALPGDRILVQPGSYPAFQFSRGVEVIGMGSSPAQVVVQGVGFHPTVPTNGWDTAVSNLTVCGGSGWGGNELAAGTLVVDSVVTCGGIFLHGAGQLYVFFVNCDIEPSPGDGFMNAALDFSGGTCDIVDTRIQGAPASEAIGATAGVALRIGAGSTVRISRSELFGGNGDALGTGSFLAGGKAVEKAYGTAPVQLRLAGSTRALGGDGVGPASGGSAIDVGGTILVGEAIVHGGAGNTGGPDYASSGPTYLAYDPHLSLSGSSQFGATSLSVHAGELVPMNVDPAIAWVTLGTTTLIDPPLNAVASPLAPGTWVRVGPSQNGAYVWQVPRSASPVFTHVTRQRVYFQGFFADPVTSALVATNPIAVTIEP